MLLSIGSPLNKTDPKHCFKNECPRKALRICLHYSFQYLTNGEFHLGLCIKVVVVVVVVVVLGQNREKAFDVELSQPHVAVPIKLSCQGNDRFPEGLFTLDAWALVPGYQHKMALCSHLEYPPICNRVHSYSLSPCETLFWNLSIARSTPHWLSQELSKNAVHTWTRCPPSAWELLRHRHGAQILSWVLEKRVCSHQCPASTVLWHRAWALPKTSSVRWI